MSLTLVVCKVFEIIFKRAILSFLGECNAITGCQHGVLPHQSCLFNLLILEVTKNRLMDNGNTTDVVYFAKAFDSVDHRLKLAKRESFDLHVKFVRWIRSGIRGPCWRRQLIGASPAVGDCYMRNDYDGWICTP